MGITAKELAARLNLSATAVSMALNGKPGVSTETRAMVIREAEKAGYDFSRLSMKKNASGDIYCIICRAHNAILIPVRWKETGRQYSYFSVNIRSG
mgnify:CR=1 FL=1